MPRPGPFGTGTLPSTNGGRLLTSLRIKGDGRKQYSIRSPFRTEAIQCREAARLMPVLKQWGTDRLPVDSVYRPVERGIRARAQAGQRGAMPVESFVIPVADGLLRDVPAAIIRGGKNSVLLPLLKKILPLRTFDALLARTFGLNHFKP